MGSQKNSFIKTGVINYGNQSKNGSHDHRSNKGADRTPAQQAGDKARRKS